MNTSWKKLPWALAVCSVCQLMLMNATILWAQVPVITNFSPKSAAPGSTIVITGNNFGASPANNIVYFGGARAQVTSASTTSISAIVPVGAIYKPVSVITGGMVAYSFQPFIPTFNGGEYFFNPKVDYAVDQNPRYVEVADFNADGHLDVLVCHVNTNTLKIFPGDGSGNLLDAVTYPVGSGGASAIGDFSGDGLLDIVVANYSAASPASSSVLLNNGSLSFQPATEYFLSNAPIGVGSGAVFVVENDFDRDGHLDVAFPIDNIPGSISVLLNQDIGTFNAKAEYPVTYYPYSVASGDFNKDGFPDLAVANFFSLTMSVMINDGAGGFPTEVTYPAESGSHDIEIADFNNDGNLDIAIENALSNTINIFTNDGTGKFPTRDSYSSGTTYQHCLSLADINGDGKLDIVTCANETSIYLVLADDQNGFQAPVPLTTGTVPASIAIGDLDEDGRPDIVTGNFTEHTISVLLSRPPGEPGSDLVIYNAVSPNADGKNDFFLLENINRPETSNNVVTIFNRWGDEVWRGKNYDNTTVFFSGVSKKGNELPAGTYFYRIELDDQTKTGYLSLRK